MPYVLPFFPLSVQIYTAGAGPPALPRLTTTGQLQPGHRRTVGAEIVPTATTPLAQMYLLLPVTTDIRGSNSPGGADIVQVPAFSGRLYSVAWSDDSAKGFTNEHRFAILIQLQPFVLDGPPAAPVVTGLNPPSGLPAGGNSVIVSGSGFATATTVTVGGVGVAFTISSNLSLTITSMPAHAVGVVDVRVTNPLGISPVVAADQYTYVNAPTVTSVTPSSGIVTGGTSVVIAGTGFLPLTNGTVFGAVAATSFVVNSAIQITANSPAEGAGVVDVQVTTPSGTSAVNAGDHYTYTSPTPTITSVTPSQGPTVGGTSVAVVGTNFTGATSVKFGSTNATSFVVNSATSITATSPAGVAGVVDVTVTTGFGTSATSGADQFTYLQSPVITSISPTFGLSAGGNTVTITGLGFTAVAGVKVGGINVTSFLVNSPTSISAVMPSFASGSEDMQVITAVGSSAFGPGDVYLYYTASVPTVTALSPNSGTHLGGTSVALTGTNFVGTSFVGFNGAPATSFVVNSPTSITAVTAAHAAGAGNAAVQNSAGTSAFGAGNAWTYT